MTVHDQDFPFVEIRDEVMGGNGDYFRTVAECTAAGFDLDQIWSVTEGDNTINWGPYHHYVNLLGYVCTHEKHDGKTYYSEASSDEADDLYEDWNMVQP